MVNAKARVETSTDEYPPIVPLVIPDLDEVRERAIELHEKGKLWEGELFGWSAEYNPEREEPPIDSKMTFTPADICIGESGIWFFTRYFISDVGTWSRC